LGPLDIEKNQIILSHLTKTVLCQEISFLRKDAFQKVGFWNAEGKVKDLKNVIFFKGRDSGCDS
jgi:hypothetical protein